MADRLGRPVAILRMGSRIPSMQLDGGFMYQPAPAYRYELPPGAGPVPRNSGIEPPIEEANGPQALQYLRRVPESQLQPWKQ